MKKNENCKRYEEKARFSIFIFNLVQVQVCMCASVEWYDGTMRLSQLINSLLFRSVIIIINIHLIVVLPFCILIFQHNLYFSLLLLLLLYICAPHLWLRLCLQFCRLQTAKYGVSREKFYNRWNEQWFSNWLSSSHRCEECWLNLFNCIYTSHTHAHILCTNQSMPTYLFIYCWRISRIFVDNYHHGSELNQLVQKHEWEWRGCVCWTWCFFHSNLITIESHSIFHLANCVFLLILDTAAARFAVCMNVLSRNDLNLPLLGTRYQTRPLEQQLSHFFGIGVTVQNRLQNQKASIPLYIYWFYYW